MSRANPKSLLAVLLCAAAATAFLPGSSAGVAPSSQLVSQTCRRTSNPLLCIDLLQSSNRTGPATNVRDLAVDAVKAAMMSAVDARIRTPDLDHGARGVVDRLVARCSRLYMDCVSAAAMAQSRVSIMRWYDEGAADAVGALRRFPEKCEGMFRERKVASPLEKMNRELEEKFGVAAEIVRLSRGSPRSNHHGAEK